MIRILRKYWDENPLVLIMGLAIFFRLLSVVFAKGWGMLDDHFIVIESSQSWVDGKDYNNWLPGSPGNNGPTGHSFFYPGIHYLLFSILKAFHLHDPQEKMFVVRFIHGFWSLITVYFGYRITERLGGRHSARIAGLLLAIYWFMPWLSVHNLVEFSCIPFLILAVWMIIRKEEKTFSLSSFLYAGLFLGLAFNIRPQTIIFSFGILLALILSRKFKEFLVCASGFVLPIILIQGTIDFYLWGKPFVEILSYFTTNFRESGNYITLPWYNYFLVIFGILLPPVSLFLVFGFVRTWKRFFMIFLPVTLFFVFHSMIPNKQERFILPIIPFLIITGTIGWTEFVKGSSFWHKRKQLYLFCWIFFWTINLVLVSVMSVVYSKKARAESMTYLSRYSGIRALFVADIEDSPELFPRFYLGQWPDMYDEIGKDDNTILMMSRVSKYPKSAQPAFILFTGNKVLPEQISVARKYFPFIVYETRIDPGFVDRTLHWLNPINKNRTVYIYRNTQVYPRKIQ